jgi:hypothetical protein
MDRSYQAFDRAEHRAEQDAKAMQRGAGARRDGNPHGPKIGQSLLASPGVPMKLEPRRTHVLKGRRSRRLRKNQWVVA